MNGIALVLRDLHRAESALHRNLLAMAGRHRAETDVVHVARIVAAWSREHAAALAEAARRHGADLDDAPPAGDPPRRGDPSLQLLADLRALYQEAAGVSLDWELLDQAAQAHREPDLSALARRCRAETVRQMRWANAQSKQSAPQALAH